MVSKTLQELNHDELLQNLRQGIQMKARHNKKVAIQKSNDSTLLSVHAVLRNKNTNQHLDSNEEKTSDLDNDNFSLSTEATFSLEVDEEEALKQKLEQQLEEVKYEFALLDD